MKLSEKHTWQVLAYLCIFESADLPNLPSVREASAFQMGSMNSEHCRLLAMTNDALSPIGTEEFPLRTKLSYLGHTYRDDT